MNHPIHPDALELVAFVSGSLAQQHAQRLHTHCLVCDTCGHQVRGLVVSSEHVVYELDCSLDIGGLLPMPAWGRWRL